MLSVYDRKFNRVAYMNNDLEGGIHYYDDELSTTISDGLYKLNLKIPKNTPLTSAISVGNYIEERTLQGKQLLMMIYDIDETGTEKNIYCVDSNIFALNTYVEAIEPPKAPEMSDYYLNHTLENVGLEVKQNDSTEPKVLSFSGEQRAFARLKEIADAFGMELNFELEFTPGEPPKRYVSLLKKRVEDFEGFRISSDTLLNNIERKLSMDNLATKMLVKGKQKPTETTAVVNTPTPTPKPEPAKDTFIETAIEKAFEIKKLGRRYQWGGNGNPSWDCSGYMQECFKAAGKAITHRWTTYSMWAQTGGHFKRISKSELKRGDMIMYDTGYTTPGDVNHVGLYLGPTLSSPNSVIHAGDPVGLTQRADSMSIIGYVRVVR